jgi:alkanesulfonate monooxygenase SsuD/methylene tetrahydromethanopterin reductase-like flavin-dependent oxidoreductase (luciferase family)
VLGDAPRNRAERTERFAEWLRLLDGLLREPVTTVRGDRFTAVEAHQLPGCVQQPRLPLTVAAAGPRAMALAARFGQGWVTYGPYADADGPEEWLVAVEEQSRRLTDALAEEGRDPSSVRRVLLTGLETTWPFESADRYADVLGRLGESGFDEVAVHWPRPDSRGVPARAMSFVTAAHGL